MCKTTISPHNIKARDVPTLPCKSCSRGCESKDFKREPKKSTWIHHPHVLGIKNFQEEPSTWSYGNLDAISLEHGIPMMLNSSKQINANKANVKMAEPRSLKSKRQNSPSTVYPRRKEISDTTTQNVERKIACKHQKQEQGSLLRYIFPFSFGRKKRNESRTHSVELASLNFEYRPQLKGYKETPIMTESLALKLAKFLPAPLRMDDWTLLYSIREHGALLEFLLERCVGKGPTVMIIKDEQGKLFGAFIPEPWTHGSFGNGQTFVFTVDKEPKVYSWAKKNAHFCYAQSTNITIGGYDNSSNSDVSSGIYYMLCIF